MTGAPFLISPFSILPWSAFPAGPGSPFLTRQKWAKERPGAAWGPRPMSVREALFSRRMVPRSLNRSPGLERRCTGLTWDPGRRFVDRTFLEPRRGGKNCLPRGLPRPPSLWLGSGAAFGSAAFAAELPSGHFPTDSTRARRSAPGPIDIRIGKSYSILGCTRHPGALRPGPHTPMVCGSVSPGPYGGAQGRGEASFWDRFYTIASAYVSLPQRFVPDFPSALSRALAPWALRPCPPSAGGRWQEGGGSFLLFLLPRASALPLGLRPCPRRGGRWQEGPRLVPDFPSCPGPAPAPWAFGPVPRPRGTLAGGRRLVPGFPSALGQRPAPWACGPVPRPRGTLAGGVNSPFLVRRCRLSRTMWLPFPPPEPPS